jgi:diaminopropionate ammonia-lyase
MARFRYAINRFRAQRVESDLLPAGDPEGRAFHRALPGYAPTPLISLPELARALGVRSLRIKDESLRFGLNAFKALGASYAIYRYLKSRWPGISPQTFLSPEAVARLPAITFTTATDGNHGRAVAWTAARLHQKAVIYVPGNTVPARIDALRGEGAEVVVVDGNYDETVKRSAHDAEAKGRQVISDTAWEGYVEIPRWIMAGYETLFAEIDEQGAAPTAVFLQAGVGGLAFAGTAHYLRAAPPPKLISVEPLDADCLLESISSPDGSVRVAKGRQDSIMAGLNCGTPSLAAWPLLRAGMDAFLAVDDEYAREAMRRLAPLKIVSGESGAAGLAGLLALCAEPGLAEARRALGIGPESDVLLISTEGATDPASYQRIVA